MKVSSVTALLLLVIILIAASCGGGATWVNDSQPAGFQLSILPETATHGASDCTWVTAVEPTASGCLVTISATGAVDQKALYFDLEYDATAVHPVSAEPVDTSLECEPLSVTILDDRGTVHYGMILPNPDARDGFSGDGVLARVEFEYGAAECGRRTSGVPTDGFSKARLDNWDSNNLGWYSSFSGDTNQDGIVTVSDLTAIGINYNIAMTPQNFWFIGQRLYDVDTDRNFEITVADITAIGRNYGKDILGGFNVYSSLDYLDYPTNPDGQNGAGAELLGNVVFKSINSDDDFRFYYAFEVLSPDAGAYYWVRPVDSNGSEGTPSRVITQLGLATSRDDSGKTELQWDAEKSRLVWGYSFPGDFSQDCFVLVEDIIYIGQNYGHVGAFAFDTIESLIDTNHDDVINARDLYVIAVNFNRSCRNSRAYAVFCSANPNDFPLLNDSQPLIDPIDEPQIDYVDFGQPRTILSVDIESPVSGMYYWVRLIDENGLCGTPSNMIQIP